MNENQKLTIMNWFIIIAWCFAFIVLGYSMPTIILEEFFQEAYAQVGEFEINAPQIQEPPKCSQVDLSSDKAYIPFQIKVYSDFSQVNDISFEQLGSSVPNTHTSPELLIFESNFIDEYQITVDINFDTDKTRAVYIEYWTQNNPSFKEIISFDGLFFCRTFNVKTAEAPTIPTRTEIIGEQAERAFEEMPLIKDSINANTYALGTSVTWMFIVVVAALAVSAGQFFAYIGRRRLEKRRVTSFETMIKVGSKYIADFRKEHGELKKQRVDEKAQMEQFLDMANIELRSYLQDLRKDANLPTRASLEIDVKPIEVNAEETSIIRKIYELVSDENLKKYLKFFKDKTSDIAKRHRDIIEEEARKRETTEMIQEEQAEEDRRVTDLLPLDYADQVILSYGKERYRNLDDEQLRLLYRSFESKNADDPNNEEYRKRLYKISEVLKIRAKEAKQKVEDVKK